MARSVEVEIKLPVADQSAIERALRRLGFAFEKRERQLDTLFDTPNLSLRKSGRLLRLRHQGRRWKLTFKGKPAADPRYKARQEIELEIPDGRTFLRVLEALGYQPTFRYEKIRWNFREEGGRGLASIDRTPIGTFLELEGPRVWIDRTARALGFSRTDYITRSYAALYFEDCLKKGSKPGDMVFR